MIIEKIEQASTEEHIPKDRLVSVVSESINYLLESDPAVSIDESKHLKKLNRKQKKLDLELKKLATVKSKVETILGRTRSKIIELKEHNHTKSDQILRELRK